METHQPATPPPNLDEWIDQVFNRPIAAVFVRGLLTTSITPNQVTLTAMVTGLVGGGLITIDTPSVVISGCLLLWLAIILDCVDGQLARARGGGTLVGRVLDGLSDLVIASAAHVGLLVAAYSGHVEFWGNNASGLSPFLWMVAAGISMIVHANLLDYHKGRYLRLIGLTSNTGDLRSDAECAYRLSTRWLDRQVLAFYVNYYCAFQETLARRSSAQVSTRPNPTFADASVVTRTLSGPLKLLAWLGPSTRMVVLILCIWATQVTSLGLETYVIIGVGICNLGFLIAAIWIRNADAKLSE